MKITRHLASILVTCAAISASADTHTFYIGTYTGGDTGSQGIYRATFDSDTGAISKPELIAETPSPSFLALHPDGKHLYAVNEADDGTISAFRITDSKLEHLNTKPTDGGAPCHLAVSGNGKCVLFANYTGGSAGAYTISDDGSLGGRSAFIQFEKPSHAHCTNLDAANKFAIIADLGLDKIHVFQFDENKGTLSASKPPFLQLDSGTGPRHFDFHPNGKFAYILGEKNRTVTALHYDATIGALSKKDAVSTLPADAKAEGSTAEIFVHPNGKFVYASNRGHDSIAVFSIDQESGALTQIQVQKTGGKTPRSFAIAPGGKFILAAGQDDNSIHVLELDPDSGKLSPTAHTIDAPAPVCILFAK